MNSNEKPKIFISYIQEDQKKAQDLYDSLRRANCDPWMDDFKMEPGKKWEREIKEAIEKSDFFISCFSSELIKKLESFFWTELDLAITKTKRRQFGKVYLIPARFDECKLPHEVLHYQVVDLFKEDGIHKILQVIEFEFRNQQINRTNEKSIHTILDRGKTKKSFSADNSIPIPPEYRYRDLFRIASCTIPYISFIGSGNRGDNEFRRGDVISQTESSLFQLPADFRNNPIPFYQKDSEYKCRLVGYDHLITPHPNPHQLTFTFSKIEYSDYLRSGEYLDNPLFENTKQTFRDKFAVDMDLDSYIRLPLSNICGVGIFILTRDDKIILSKHSAHVIVFSNVWSYSASGTMDWKENVHPFDEVARECYEEIRHHVNLNNTYLFGIGIDTKKLYFQFSFFERSGLSADDIIQKAPLAKDYHAEIKLLEPISLDLDSIVKLIEKEDWEPAAAAGLLTLCIKEFGLERVERAIDREFVHMRFKNAMEFEWNQRAMRPGDLAVMSGRYPYSQCSEESHKYVQAVTNFIGNDVDGKDILELGCGIGRFTMWLVERAGNLTCLDISDKMIARSRQQLGDLVDKVVYHRMLGQEYSTSKKHDVIISSLVLIHNVSDDAFGKLVSVMSECADTIFLFEHIGDGSKYDPNTRLRAEKDIRSAFSGYNVEKRNVYKLFDDNIIFLKLCKTKG